MKVSGCPDWTVERSQNVILHGQAPSGPWLVLAACRDDCEYCTWICKRCFQVPFIQKKTATVGRSTVTSSNTSTERVHPVYFHRKDHAEEVPDCGSRPVLGQHTHTNPVMNGTVVELPFIAWVRPNAGTQMQKKALATSSI